MSDPETQIGGLLTIAEGQLQAAADLQRNTASTLAALKTQVGDLAALGPRLAAGVKAGAAEGAKAAVLDASGDLKSTIGEVRATAAKAGQELVDSVAKFRRDWAVSLVGALAVFVVLLAVLIVGVTWWARSDLQSLQDRKEALQADVAKLEASQTDLERKGRRLIWNTCGGKLCFAVSPRDPGTWSENGARYAIPLETR